MQERHGTDIVESAGMEQVITFSMKLETDFSESDAGQIRTAVVSFNIAGVSPSEAALQLDERFGILCRSGLHCAPVVHRAIGTFSRGTIRFGFGYLNKDEEISFALEAIRSLAAGA
jgi:selenocysteine lyase/cysteine desulfurase